MGYCDRRIALWTKYKTDLAIRMLPSEVRGRSGSHSGSMISSAMTRALGVAMKPRSRAASQSRSRVESSIHIDGNDKEMNSTRTAPHTKDTSSRDSSYNPYSSNKDASSNVALHSAKGSQRKDNSYRMNPAAGGGGATASKGSSLAPITSGN